MILSNVIAAYPSVRFMEIEPLQFMTQTATWKQDVITFHTGLRQQLGKTVEVMQSDVQWQFPTWMPAMVELHQFVKEHNLGYSVIYDASALAASDSDWIASATANFEAVEGGLGIIPEHVLFTSWDPYPAYNMPDTSPTAQTWLINRYPRPRSILQAEFRGRGAKGILTTTDRKPMPVTTVTGTVPSTAVTGLIGIRVNTECGCDGNNNLVIGNIGYQETQGGSSAYTTNFSLAEQTSNGASLGATFVGGATVNQIVAHPGQSVLLNSDQFPVTANAQYAFNIPAATVAGVGWSGNVILIFIDAQGNGTRVTVVPPPGKALEATAVTGPDGRFSFPFIPRSVDGPFPVTIEFDGMNGTYRSSVWTPLQ